MSDDNKKDTCVCGHAKKDHRTTGCIGTGDRPFCPCNGYEPSSGSERSERTYTESELAARVALEHKPMNQCGGSCNHPYACRSDSSGAELICLVCVEQREARLAERAALLRQVAELCDASMSQILVEKGEFVRLKKKILAIPTDQSALARVNAAAYARAKRDAAQAAESEIENELGNINDSTLKTIRRVVRAILALQDRGREAEK